MVPWCRLSLGLGFCEPCPVCRSPWVALTAHSGALLTLSCFSLLSTYLDPLQALNSPPAAIPTSRSSSISASCDQESYSSHCQHQRGFPQRGERTTIGQVTEAKSYFLVSSPFSSPFTSSPSMDLIHSIPKHISDPPTSLRLCHRLLSVL